MQTGKPKHIDPRLIDKILVRTINDGFWHREVEHSELKTVHDKHNVKTAHGDPAKIVINEGTDGKWVDVRAINFVIALMWDREYIFDLIQDESPDRGKEVIDRHITVELISPSDAPQLREDLFDIRRTKDWVADASRLAACLTGDIRTDEPEGDYVYRLFKILASSETKLNLGTNPRNHAKEFYGWIGPVRLAAERQDKISEAVFESKSAADFNWEQ